MSRRPPSSTLSDSLFPYTTLFRSTSSILNGLMIASIFFTLLVPLWAGRRPSRAKPDQVRLVRSAVESVRCPAILHQSRAVPIGESRSEERRVGKSVSVRVDLGGRRSIKKKIKTTIIEQHIQTTTKKI